MHQWNISLYWNHYGGMLSITLQVLQNIRVLNIN